MPMPRDPEDIKITVWRKNKRTTMKLRYLNLIADEELVSLPDSRFKAVYDFLQSSPDWKYNHSGGFWKRNGT